MEETKNTEIKKTIDFACCIKDYDNLFGDIFGYV